MQPSPCKYGLAAVNHVLLARTGVVTTAYGHNCIHQTPMKTRLYVITYNNVFVYTFHNSMNIGGEFATRAKDISSRLGGALFTVGTYQQRN